MAQGPIMIPPQGPTPVETAAVALSVLWAVLVAVWVWWLGGEGTAAGLRWLVLLVAVGVPVALVALWLVTARALRAVTADVARLQQALEKAAPTAPLAAPPVPLRPVQPAIAALKPVVRAAPKPKPKPAPRAAAVADQPGLAFGGLPDDDSPPLDRPDLIRALNFPDSASDAAGFAALHRALRDPTARPLVQASQDVLTLLSQDGLYMDDLRPDASRADLWRRFAKGERGQALQDMGAVRDDAALTVVSARMREDTVFRDAVHHFLRRFDLILVSFETEASDADLLALAETRTARAFMLLGRASRMFD